jgi:hypothetical protein
LIVAVFLVLTASPPAEVMNSDLSVARRVWKALQESWSDCTPYTGEVWPRSCRIAIWRGGGAEKLDEARVRKEYDDLHWQLHLL